MDLSPVILSIPLFFILIGLELLYTLLKRPDYYRVSDAVSNISCGIGDQVVGVFAKVLVIGVYHFLYVNYALFQFEQTIWSFIILFVAADFIYYWVHRSSHEVNFLWAGHVVHHQSEDYNLSVALRQSWFHKFFTFAFYLPLALIGFSTEAFIWANGLNQLYQFFIHTEAVERLGFLEKFMNTPSHHRVHHGRNPKYIDKNHAGVFIIWDKLFGTFQPEEERPVYGVTQPLQTFNPLYANVVHWQVMFRQAAATPRWADRFKTFVKPPGWRPDYMGGQLAVPEVDPSSHKKFTAEASRALLSYVVVQFTLLLGFASFYLFGYEQLPGLRVQLAGALLVMLGVVSLSLLFERKKRYYLLEVVRQVLMLLFLFLLLQGHELAHPLLFAASGVTFFSLLWLMLAHKRS
jgi:sterol desaturase/sphingolipid hydroxylase (fatty acid hydroxylase superfamily)